MSRSDPCLHHHGEHVSPLMGWVCGQCYAILSEQPKRYGMVQALGVRAEDVCPAPPMQQVVWQAEVRRSLEGTTLAIFLAAIANRFMKRTDIDRAAAYAAALDVLKGQGVIFGDPKEDWSVESAEELADEDMSYWDAEEAASNG